MSFPGTRKRVTITTTDQTLPTPALADPTALTVKYGPVGGATPTTKTYPTDPEVVRTAVGTFRIDIDCPTAGPWAVRANATAGVVGVSEMTWVVAASNF